MKLYSTDFKSFEFTNLEYLNEGGCGKVYRCDGLLIKIFNPECSYFSKIKKNIFEILRLLDVYNVVKLKDMYFKYKFHIKSRPDAYTMSEITGNHVELIDCDRKFIIEVFRELDRSIRILSENGIVIDDIKSQNMVINEDGIFLLDPDLFYKWGIFDNATAYEINKAKLIFYFNGILRDSLIKHAGVDNCKFIESHPNCSLLDDLMLSMTEENVIDSMLSNPKIIKYSNK